MANNTDRTNVPDIAMSFSDARFAYGPFVPHDVPRQYLQNYFSTHKVDKFLELNTTVEDVSIVKSTTKEKDDGWKLTLRKHDAVRDVDIWWEEYFDVVIIANGHYTVPFVSILFSFFHPFLVMWLIMGRFHL